MGAALQSRMRSPFNPGPLLEEYGDAALVRELTQLFIDSASSQMEAVTAAAARGDALAIKAAAHRLRGALSTFGAASATQLALTLESMSESGNLDGAGAVATALDDEVRELCKGAATWLSEHAA